MAQMRLVSGSSNARCYSGVCTYCLVWNQGSVCHRRTPGAHKLIQERLAVAELVTFDNRLWAASGIVSDVRFRATCAVAGQLSAAQERVLGSDSGSAEPLTSLLGPSMHGPPYPCMYPCSQTHLGSDVKVRTNLVLACHRSSTTDRLHFLCRMCTCRVVSLWKTRAEQSVRESRQ